MTLTTNSSLKMIPTTNCSQKEDSFYKSLGDDEVHCPRGKRYIIWSLSEIYLNFYEILCSRSFYHRRERVGNIAQYNTEL